MGGQPDEDELYFQHALIDAEPGGPRRVDQRPAALWQRWWRQQAAGPEPLRTAAAQGFVLGVADLGELQISRAMARTRIARGDWIVPARGRIAPLRVDDASRHVTARRRHALTSAAAVLDRPDYVVSSRSASILRGLPTLAVPPRAEITRIGDQRLGHRTGAHVSGARLPLDATTRWFGVPVTSIARTLVDLGRHDRRDALMAADAAMRERLVTDADLERELDRAVGWPGVVQARAILALRNGKAESPLESLTRLALHDSGFPPPELQFVIGRYAVDLCWPERRLVVEVDGRGKYSADALWDEKRRESELRRFGYRIERVIWSDVMRDWAATSERIWFAWRD